MIQVYHQTIHDDGLQHDEQKKGDRRQLDDDDGRMEQCH